MQLRDPENRPTVVILTGTLLFTLWQAFSRPAFYREHLIDFLQFTNHPVTDAGIYWALCNLTLTAILLIIIRRGFRASWSDFGLGAGKIGFGMSRLVVAAPIVIGIGYLIAQQQAFQRYYPINKGVEESANLFALHVVVLLTYYIAWEVLFRSFFQFGTKAQLGIASAIAVQTLASTLAHTDRPAVELIGSFFAGVGWGVMVSRAGAIWTVILQHWILGIALSYFICFG